VGEPLAHHFKALEYLAVLILEIEGGTPKLSLIAVKVREHYIHR
jgi:hypothetical protein